MLTIEQAAQKLGLKKISVMQYLSDGKLDRVVVNQQSYITKESVDRWGARKNIEYAIYKGDSFIDLGTAQELSERLGIKERTIKYYATNTHHNRTAQEGTIAIKIWWTIKEWSSDKSRKKKARTPFKEVK